MARARRPNEPTSYQGLPEIPDTLVRKMELVRGVIGGTITISDAARQLGIARVNMQTIVHRVETAIAKELEPRATGRKPTPEPQKALEARIKDLEKLNEKLQKQLLAADDMMMAAGEIIRHLRGLEPTPSRTSSTRSKRSPPKPSNSDDDPERAVTTTIRAPLMRLAVTSRDDVRTATLVGVAVKTWRRWVGRLLRGEPLIQRRGGVRQPGPNESEQQIRNVVRELHGLPGAASLARHVDGVSRRRAAELKEEVLVDVERERKRGCARVEVTHPGILRAMDAMYLDNGFALIASDGCVPFRTSAQHAIRYDAEHVAAMLETDFQMHGAPLVLRDDRARCHTAEPVMSVLRAHRVALLQGPPYHAQYYGQLERQNREHRHWLSWLEPTTDDIQTELDRMKAALNQRWLRPTLGWRSAAQCWHTRPALEHERCSFLDDVDERAARLRSHQLESRLAMRLAIEQALTHRGYLRVTPGRSALCE